VSAVTRRRLTAAVVAMQLLLFTAAAWVARGHWQYSDNWAYERPAWTLSQGHGLSIERAEWDDPYLSGLYFTRHPDADPAYLPATVFPPGYSIFLAGVYAIAGRSELAAIVANGLLLGVCVWMAAAIMRRALGEGRAWLLSLGLLAFWPFGAYWAAKMTSDTLHAALMLAFALALFTDRPSTRNALLAGALLGAATMVRGYTLLMLPAFFLLWCVWRHPAISPRRLLLAGLVFAVIVGSWTARNYHHFGKPIALSSIGPGIGLWIASYDYIEGRVPDDAQMWEDWAKVGAKDPYRYEDHQRLMAAVLDRIRQHPGAWAAYSAKRLVRLWLPGTDVASGPVLWALWGTLGSLLVLTIWGAAGAWRSPNAALLGAVAIVVYYGLVFVPLNVEGRYLLPARPFSFLLAASAVGPWLARRKA
jgi:hypothetical protein